MISGIVKWVFFINDLDSGFVCFDDNMVNFINLVFYLWMKNDGVFCCCLGVKFCRIRYFK